MRRKRATLLFGGLGALVLGYAAWCGRTFYLSVPVPELLELPEAYRADARSLVIKYRLNKPDHFDWEESTKYLSRPYDSSRTPIIVQADDAPGAFNVHRERSIKSHPDLVGLHFRKKAVGYTVTVIDWKSVTRLEYRELFAGSPFPPP
jgi:hypothetical protein